MGLLDFVVHRGTMFTNDEIELLDKNFINISEFTDNKYNFHQKYIEKDVQLLEAIGVNRHEINYRHKHFKHKEIEIVIQCLKYNVTNKRQMLNLYGFYGMDVPSSGKVLFIDIIGSGFFHLIKYDNNGNVSLKNKEIFKKKVEDTFESLNIK